MSEEENDGLTESVRIIIDSSEEEVITCHDINDALAKRKIGPYYRGAIFEAMESISKQSEGKFKMTIVTRMSKSEFAIRKQRNLL